MAHHVEPMDVDCMDSDFDNKENTYHHSNVLPCTEKGYEELDVSELNMKLRYSMTPASSPMSRSYTASHDNRNLDNDDSLNCNNENNSLSRSLNSTMTKNDSVIKCLKSLPLQSLPSEQFIDGNANASVLRQLDATITGDANVTVTVSGTNDFDENLSLPSTSSSALHTPEATTPTKEMTKDGGSPIIRGLKSVLNMFRSSQSPIPPSEGDNTMVKQEELSPADVLISENSPQAVASTPIAAHRAKDGNNSKRNSPYKDSIAFNDDLEKELNWKDETTIIFSHEKIPVHKLFFQNTKSVPENKLSETEIDAPNSNKEGNLNAAVEFMDISYNDSLLKEKTVIESQEVSFAVESDSEFVDCETTFSKNESHILETREIEGKDILPTANEHTLDLTEHISLTNANIPVANPPDLYDITGLSLTDGELKNDLSEPSDYSNYSKETSEILSELEKLEEKVTSKVELNKENYSALKNIPEKEKVKGIQATPVVTVTNVISENDKQQQYIETVEENNKPEIENTESQNHQLNITGVVNTAQEEQNSTFTQPMEELKTLDTQIEAKQKMESLIVSDNISIRSQDTVPIIPNESDDNIIQVLSDAGDPKPHSPDILQINPHEANGQILEAVCNVSTDFNTHQDVLQISQNQDTDNMSQLGDVTMDSNPQIVNVEPTILETNFEKDVDNTKSQSMVEIQMSLLANEASIVCTSSEQDIVPLELLESTQEKNIPETLNNSPTQKLVDELFPDAECQKDTFDMMATEILNETQNIVDPKTIRVFEIQKPSDIPLPDEDDMDNEVTIAGVSATTPTEIAPVILPETLDVTNILTEIINETISKDLPDIFVEDKIENDSTRHEFLKCTSPKPPVDKLVDGLETAITALKLDITETLSETPLDHSNIEMLPEHDNIMSIETETHLPSEALELTTDIFCKSDVTEYKESFAKTVPETKISDLLPEDVSSSNNMVTDNETYKHVPNDLTEIVNQSKVVTDTLYATVTKDKFEPDQEKTHNMEQMDITINESLNQTQDLSNLANQTVVMIDENGQTVTPTNLTGETPAREELADHPKTVEIRTHLETQLNREALAAEDTNKDVSEMKRNIDSVNLVETTPQKNDSIDYVSPSVKTFLPTTDENKSHFVLENISANNPINNPDMKLSDNEPMVNTLDVENKEVEITTVEEEILVSENNSPYVSLMAGVESLTGKIEETFEDIQNPLVTNANMPSSPPIISKGYNFNFDDMVDPFATKTKIRLSPPLDTPNQANEDEKAKLFEVPKRGTGNRRKSQPVERKKPAAMKKKFNNTFDENSASKQPVNKIEAIMEDTKSKHVPKTEIKCEAFDNMPLQQEKQVENAVNQLDYPLESSLENKSSVDSIATVSNNMKTTSSSELSTYYSADTSSTDSLKSKNVFNIPEIDDINFNPFATKSKMRQSPPPDLKVETPFATTTKLRSTPETSMIVSPQVDTNSTITIDDSKLAHQVKKVDPDDKMETELMEKETSNISNTTSSSKATDHLNLSPREVNTEDEDTIEGPFLEVEDIIDKMSDFDAGNVDMMQFNDVPVQEAEDNPEEGELFIDAEAYEFLLNQNTNVVADSGKESLFLKFDPLFAKRISSAGVLEALSKVQKKQSTPTKPIRPSLRSEESPIAGPSTLNATYEGSTNESQEMNEDMNITVSKPMMVVTPAVNPAVTPRHKSITPNRSNRRSITFTSPAIAVIDRLLSMSANNSFLGQDTTITQTHREQTEADLALTQLRELLAEKEISVYSLRSESKELKDRLSIMESQVRILEADGQERLKKINELNERLVEKTKINKSMAAVVEEYERTIASLIAETEQDKKRNAEERIRLINERDEQTAHLTSMEVSFSDLHSKYEKSKQVILACKANEETCKKSIKEFEENLTKMQANYEMLKQHATSKLNHANQELEKLNRAHESEVVKLHAMIKRKDLHITSLEETLAQKTKANEELTAICDELINKVG